MSPHLASSIGLLLALLLCAGPSSPALCAAARGLLQDDQAQAQAQAQDQSQQVTVIAPGAAPGAAPAPDEVGYITSAGKSILGNDISCDQKQSDGSDAPFCRVCGGRRSVRARCDANSRCVAFDMETPDCGYLKAARGPLEPHEGFTSYAQQ
ncbi:hypothetical protein MNEG_0502 [Monoraphidium neglectum]|uniref:Apple domain-containing protein n=1 Tax=Monoraphidium neglectum TaxID=145388 RepID=A0A0D2KB50_9CHLO|nr:hypothetical protein MNEG_0502 [Monoraphidium neglectum]KIZ07453.1 hypothetical protein MNEG_0502 [Monoraphidium neglectum]|eukprot:XP_013906472.1 hypothetical protein MNEG_0502 [Monoraphidium neglectum]